MPGTLTFPIGDDLKAIIAHARSAPERSPSFAELFDPAIRLDGREPAADVTPTERDIDPTRIPHGLWLVMDHGVYLMSCGKPPLPSRDGTGNLVAYARECDPTNDDCWDNQTAIVGGDDGVDKLDLDFFEKAIAGGATTIRVAVSETSLALEAS